MNWFVLYTKSRNEKIVAERLLARGIEAFCPTLRKRKVWSDRIKVVVEPLFRSYCFVRIDEKERNRVFEVEGVVRYLFLEKKPAIVRDIEIQAIRDLLAGYEHEQIELETFRPDDRVVIQSGVLYDQEATVIENNGTHLVLNVPAMSATIKVKMLPHEAKKIG